MARLIKSDIGFKWPEHAYKIMEHPDFAIGDWSEMRSLSVMWSTNKEEAERVIPAPLELASPTCIAYLCHYHRVTNCKGYSQGGLLLPVTYNGENGAYCLSMPCDEYRGFDADMNVFGGITSGHAKRYSKIVLNREGNHIEGSIERHGIKFFKVEAELNGKANNSEFETTISPELKFVNILFNLYPVQFGIKKDEKGNWIEFPYTKIGRSINHVRIYSQEIGIANVELAVSVDDPWATLPVNEVLGAIYEIKSNRMDKIVPVEYFMGDELKRLMPYIMKLYDRSSYDWRSAHNLKRWNDPEEFFDFSTTWESK